MKSIKPKNGNHVTIFFFNFDDVFLRCRSSNDDNDVDDSSDNDVDDSSDT